jgi:hypothetical protein
MPKDKLRIFFSLLNYCIKVYSNVWGLQTYNEQDRKSTAFKKEDNMKLQVLVNKVLRSLTGLDCDTPSSLLSSKTGQLSVHQRTALFTLTSVHKALRAKEPSYSSSQSQILVNLFASKPTAAMLTSSSQSQIN